jgi:hypothetical protein
MFVFWRLLISVVFIGKKFLLIPRRIVQGEVLRNAKALVLS